MGDDARFLVGISGLTAQEQSRLEDDGLRIDPEYTTATLRGGWTGDFDWSVVDERSWLTVEAPDRSAALERVETALRREDATPGDLIVAAQKPQT